jgi:hypothetical protein
MMIADIFIIFDTAQFVKDDFHNRNRIRNNSLEGYKWLTVPVNKKRIPIKDIVINDNFSYKDMKWNEFHYYTINDCYKKAPFYKGHENFLCWLYNKKWNSLIDINLAIIKYLREIFDIRTPVLKASEMNIDAGNDDHKIEEDSISHHGLNASKNLNATKKIIEICKKAGADTYISGAGGKDYMAESLFIESGIKVEYQCFRHPVYSQIYAPFVPNLSAIDYIMNVDAKSNRLLG